MANIYLEILCEKNMTLCYIGTFEQIWYLVKVMLLNVCQTLIVGDHVISSG